MFSLLIKDTTRAQREEIVRRSLNACGSPCDGCNGCGNAGGGRIVKHRGDRRPPHPEPLTKMPGGTPKGAPRSLTAVPARRPPARR